MTKICSFDPCDNPAKSKALCGGHYQQQHKGLPLKPLRALLSASYTEDGLKVCQYCGEAKNPITGFYKMSGNACRDCHNKKGKRWRENNPDRRARISRDWRKANEGHIYTDKSTGYEIYVGYEHPGALSCGITRYHRIVLWDKIGPGIHACHWCGRDVYWDRLITEDWYTTLVVDHVDWNKSNNDPDNLVPACNACNVSKDRKNPNGKKN